MSSTALYVVLILVFISISGVFAAAEMALVSLRDSQVKQLAHRGKRGQTVARLAGNPNRFLSTVQVGVTLSGYLSAAFGGATLADALAPKLETLGLGQGAASTVSLIGITLAISYVSIVIGELAAKRLALQRAEAVALSLAPLVDFVATLARPVIWLLGASTNVVVKILGGDPNAGKDEVSDEEIRALVSGSLTLGREERQIVDDVFAAGSRSLREVMVPRTEVDFLPGEMPAYRAVRELHQAPHSRYPVLGDSADDIVGFVHVRDLLSPGVSTRTTPVSEMARPVLSMPDTVRVLRALTEMRRTAAHMAIVLDEYGGTAGIVTLEDLVEELVGDITDEYDVVEEAEQPNARGDLEIDGLSTLDEFAEKTGLVLPEGHYDTLAGYFMAELGQLPALDDVVETDVRTAEDEEQTARLELRVTELDGRRAASFRVRRTDGPNLQPTRDVS